MAIDDTVYGYDGEGRRVKKTNVLSGNRTIYIYDTFGKLAAEYFEGTPTATVGTFYRTLDHLGSTRVVTDASGAEASRLDYTPFGELVPTSLGGRTSSPGYDTDAGIRQKFTGKERDDESTLDFFLARYYSASMGRFLSSDTTGYSSIRQPGSWNLYAYALNNPLKFNDPTGHIVELASCSTIGNCQRELAAIQSALASDEAAGRLTVQELKGKRSFLDRLLDREAKSKFTVAIEGDVGEFRGLSANAGRIGALIESESVVSFSLSNIRRDPGGGLRPVAGGFSDLPSQGFNPAQVVVRSDGQTARFDQDTRGIIGGQVGRIPGASFSETVAHEFGHPFAEIIKGHPAGSIANKREAVLSENEVRRTDPERGFKIRHGVQVLRQGDLPQ